MLCGKFHALLELGVPPTKRRRDGDNLMKICFDYAIRVGLIKDDSLCEKGTFMWVNADVAPPHGCRLTLWDAMSEPIIYDFEEIKAHLERIKVERELDEAALLDQANKPDVPVAAGRLGRFR